VIAQVRATGISTLIVDRNHHAVLAHTDRAVLLEKGLAVAAGASSELASDNATLARYLGV
jgi:branched-chain amino acid transport system ATP-binding protein